MSDTRLPIGNETLDDLIEWAKTCRYFGPDDFEKLARLANRTESLREYVHGLGGWLEDDPEEAR